MREIRCTVFVKSSWGRFFSDVTFKQRYEGGERAAILQLWGGGFHGRRNTSAKGLRQGHVLGLWEEAYVMEVE